MHLGRVARVCIVAASTLVLMSCGKGSEGDEGARQSVFTKFSKEAQVCGRTVRLSDPAAEFKRSGKFLGLSINLDKHFGTGSSFMGSVDVQLTCKKSGPFSYEIADLTREKWDRVTFSDKYGLYKLARRNGYYRELFYQAPKNKYIKPDGSPFVLECRLVSNMPSPPDCRVYFYGGGSLHVSYIYLAGHGLAKWKAIDELVRDQLEVQR